MAVKRLEARMGLERFALRRAEPRELIGVRARIEHFSELRKPNACGCGPVDEIGGFERRIRHRRFCMQHVEHDAAGRCVGAEPVGIGGELRMDRADRDRVCAARPRRAHEITQRAEVADPRIACASERIQLNRKSPATIAWHAHASRWRDGKCGLAIAAFERVVARQRDRLHRVSALDDRAVLQRDPELALHARRYRLSDHRGYERQRFRGLRCARVAFANGRIAMRRQVEGLENGLQSFWRNIVETPLVIPPTRGETDRLRQSNKVGHARRRG